jgi:predicted Zn-dependent peptidase
MRFVALCLSFASLPASAGAQSIATEELILGNGLKVVLAPDHTVPNVCLALSFRVGSRNERPGITGISHLFEHMMFNGSKNYKPTEFDHILESGGGYSNAYTSNDITFYYEEFNPNLLEKVLHIEADRMRWLTIDSSNLEQERGIVKEERRVSTDNSLSGTMYELLYANAFVAHPYQNPVVGWMGDLDNITLPDARDYFTTYYTPNNATMFIVGDFDPKTVRAVATELFGTIPRRERPRPVVNSEPAQTGGKRINLLRGAELPAVLIGYKSAGASSPDIHALHLLATLLGRGQSSRLYRRLVHEKSIVPEIYVGVDELIDPGLFTIYAQMQGEHSVEEAESEIRKVVDDVIDHGVSEQEVQKARNTALTEYVDQLKTHVGIAGRMGYYEVVYGDYRKAFEVLGRYGEVTAEDIRRVAGTYLREDRQTVVVLIPERQENEVKD